MPMFLILMVACFPVLVLCAVALLRQESREQSPTTTRPEQRMAIPEPRFFAAVSETPIPSRLPRDLLLKQIERHVRLEVAAAESFLDTPTTDSLHAESGSPLLN